jgi:hypothetical protein
MRRLGYLEKREAGGWAVRETRAWTGPKVGKETGAVGVVTLCMAVLYTMEEAEKRAVKTLGGTAAERRDECRAA